MKPESSESYTRSRTPLPWIMNGAALAPLLVILYSYTQLDESMRDVPVLLVVTIVGAMGGKLAFAINKPYRQPNWKSPLLFLLSLICYGFAVFLSFVMVRLGPF